MAKKLTPEQEKEIKLLKAQNEMLERSRQEALQRGKEDVAKRIAIAQQDGIAQAAKIDQGIAQQIKIESEEIVKKGNVNTSLLDDYDINDILAISSEEKNADEEKKQNQKELNEKVERAYYEETQDDTDEQITNLDTLTNIDSNVQYDIIALPSNGECYKNKIAKVPVSYLTAYDENFITSPNLYKDGLVIDFLLKNKIVGEAINPDDLVSGDADAITLFLRATSYGAEFPIVANDPETGKQIETVVDLTKLKSREFKLKGDENGNFDFTLPITKKLVKFRYLTRKQERDLQTLTKIESNGTKAELIASAMKSIASATIGDKILSDSDRKEFERVTKICEKWTTKLKEKSDLAYNRVITNSLQMQIVSIDGDTDKKNIRKFINDMPARDSLMLRRYITENRPGIDFEVEVERPESLGGGSFKTFLNWDDSVFLNIPEL